MQVGLPQIRGRTRQIRAVVSALFLVIVPARAAAQGAALGIYSDPSRSSCTLSDGGAGILRAYVVVISQSGVTGVRFAVPTPPCFKATWLADEVPEGLVRIGDSQTGISVAFGPCADEPQHVLTLVYQTTGSTGACCELPVAPDPFVGEIQYADCNFVEHTATSLSAIVNGDESCPCAGPLDFPPRAPDAPSPADGATGQSIYPLVYWRASEPEGQPLHFDVYLGDTPNPSRVASDITTASFQAGPLAYATTYYWKVVAFDPANHSTEGPVWSFATRLPPSPPPAPSNPAPGAGAIDQARALNLTWTVDPQYLDPLTYDVYFGTAPDPPLLAAYNPGAWIRVSYLALDTVYYWRVVARSPDGATTSGPVWSFRTTAVNVLPSAAYHPTPPDHAIHPVASTLQWLGGADPDGGPVAFDVYFGTESDPPLLAAGVTNRYQQIGELVPEVDYYWRVVVNDADGGSTSGPVWTFRPGSNLAPAVPFNPDPPDSGVATSLDVTLGWTSSDPEGDEITFDVYFGTTTTPRYVLTVTTQLAHLAPLQPGRRYYWKVVARDPAGLTSAGPLWTFTTRESSPPIAPFNPSPADSALDVSRRLTLTWQSGDPEGGPVHYELYFGTTNPPPLLPGILNTSSYKPSLLPRDTRHYWRVRAWDSHGKDTLGPLWTFVTSASNLPPELTSNPIPADGDTDLPSQVDLQWTGSDPEGLRIWYDVYFGETAAPPRVAANLVTPAFIASALSVSTHYYWRIVARDEDGNVTQGPLWSFLTAAVFKGELSIGLYSDPEGTACTLDDVSAGLRNVYVVIDGPTTYTGLRLRAPRPACFNATWVEDSSPFVTFGNSQTGISVGFGLCDTPPVMALTITYLSAGNTPGCCSYPALADPDVGFLLATDCNFAELTAASDPALSISSDGSCPPCGRSAYLQFVAAEDTCHAGLAHPLSLDVLLSPGPGGASAGGFDVEFDPSVLTFVACERGELTQTWDSFTYSESGGVITVAGIADADYDPTRTGTFARLTFESNCCTWNAPLTLQLRRATGDFSELRLVEGRFMCRFLEDGDITNDGSLTVADAQCALESYLYAPGKPPGGCAGEGPSPIARADVDCSHSLTPADAHCIFRQWLDHSCSFCAGEGTTALTARRGPASKVSLRAVDEEDEVVIVLRAAGLDAVGAVGFDLDYPADLTFVRVEATSPRIFEALQSRVMQSGRLRIGAYATESAVPFVAGDLLAIRFRSAGVAEGVVTARAFVDDLAGAADAAVRLDGVPVADHVVLYPNSPNPFNPRTSIRFDLPRAGRARLAIFDVTGARVRTLFDGRRDPGTTRLEWDGTDEAGRTVATGMYFCVLDAGGRRYQQKMVLLK